MAILLNRPATRNAIDVAMRDALFEAFSLAAMSTDIARVDVRGAGDSFSIGGALGEFGQVASGVCAHLIRTERLPARILADHGHKFHFHLHGAVVGAGLEIAAFGGRITATPSTFMRLPEIGMALIPGAGGCVSVTRRLGRQGAAWLIITGVRISARTALRWGLIDEIGD
jgi:enoyl-CoA hydratase/carnithine racemase